MDSDLMQRMSDGADELFDEILPESLDWRRMVCDYPLPALAVAAAGGFWIGRRHGEIVLSGLLAYGSAEMSRVVGEALGRVLGSNPFEGDSYDGDSFEGDSYDRNSYDRNSYDGDSFDETDFAGA